MVLMATEFGGTEWGRAWVRTIESSAATAPNPQLPTARSLARNSAVALTAASGRVDADVQVSGRSHRVGIIVPPWSDEERDCVARLLARALTRPHADRTGDLPDTVVAELRSENIAVAAGELDTADCDCRARRRPCAHILATIYTLAQRIDERPMLAVELRSPEIAALPADPDWLDLDAVDAATFYGD
jgi:uncharacterized Zn finger protein